MCLAIPGEIISISGDQAMVNVGGVHKEISLALINEPAIGDYVLVHVGYALNKISAEEAEKTLAMFAQAELFVQDE